MGVMSVAKVARRRETSDTLFERIGTFLADHRLDPTPEAYTVVHAVLSDPDGPLARAVDALCEGGVRLTPQDILSLGQPAGPNPKQTKEKTDRLVARTQMQVESFGDTITAMHAEAQDFGRELAASADAIARVRTPDRTQTELLDEVARITTTMIGRVRAAESQLEQATREAAVLRDQLDEARDNARRDPLTDLPNRRAFEEAYAAQQADGVLTCLAVCDIDHFKSVNDRFGHVVGDRVLKAVASVLAKSCTGHLVARYGGEEFVVLFRGLSLPKAAAILEEARIAVSRKHYRLRDSDQPLGEITFSGGIAIAGERDACGTVFHRADRLLYDAKNSGRNKVLSA